MGLYYYELAIDKLKNANSSFANHYFPESPSIVATAELKKGVFLEFTEKNNVVKTHLIRDFGCWSASEVADCIKLKTRVFKYGNLDILDQDSQKLKFKIRYLAVIPSNLIQQTQNYLDYMEQCTIEMMSLNKFFNSLSQEQQADDKVYSVVNN